MHCFGNGSRVTFRFQLHSSVLYMFSCRLHMHCLHAQSVLMTSFTVAIRVTLTFTRQP